MATSASPPGPLSWEERGRTATATVRTASSGIVTVAGMTAGAIGAAGGGIAAETVAPRDKVALRGTSPPPSGCAPVARGSAPKSGGRARAVPEAALREEAEEGITAAGEGKVSGVKADGIAAGTAAPRDATSPRDAESSRAVESSRIKAVPRGRAMPCRAAVPRVTSPPPGDCATAPDAPKEEGPRAIAPEAAEADGIAGETPAPRGRRVPC